MNLAAHLALVASEAESHGGNVALETVVFGIIAAAVFALLGLVTFSYRNVANRHSAKAEAWAAEHGKDGHGAGHGH
ncbi:MULTISPECIES: hypothetical protein [Bacteria]|uniref:hypothetical protein n=1 Tax=Bacteria TaxID=2 RepID=UPI0018CEDAB9